jgi:HlyD family secretion protein
MRELLNVMFLNWLKWVVRNQVMLLLSLALVLGGVLLAKPLWSDWFHSPLLFNGVLQAEEVKNGSRLGGRVSAVLVKEGMEVAEGTALIQFENKEILAKLMEAEASLAEVKAKKELLLTAISPNDIQQAQAKVQQSNQRIALLANGGRPEELSEAQAKVREMEAKVRVCKNQLAQAKQVLASGIIAQQKVDEVQNNLDSAQSALMAAEARVSLIQKGARVEEIGIAKAERAGATAQLSKLQEPVKPAELKIADAEIQRAASIVQGLKVKMEESTVRSPINGTVNLLSVSLGQVVPPDVPAVNILDSNHLWVDLFIPESKLQFLHRLQKVTLISKAYPKATFLGEVAFISPKSEFVPSSSGATADASTGTEATFRIRIEVSPPADVNAIRLFPGMSVQVLVNQDMK